MPSKFISLNPPVAVVIPVYKSQLTVSERISLEQCIKILSAYPIIVAKPQSLCLSNLLAEYPNLETVSFEDRYFSNIAGYNALLISPHFYGMFRMYEFVLIYQLDAYVFRDELEQWCEAGYDYIGAPSLHHTAFDSLSEMEAATFSNALSTHRIVLNGGLSLRRIPAILRYLSIYNIFYPVWKGNEDMLFSQDATRLMPMKLFLKTPTWKKALHFAFEKSPAASYALTGGQLPFACHAWERYDPSFWLTHIHTNG
ncbi:DUF5672 family protein [Dyadobacter tibetensis]|uniref:DUF5672 family protein n=1 Tax=Dyadobacter tibetensis TaxID=1211851 RepID=UPI0005C5CC34|nr:DUF5672 family protein [Dyadobacter tibetensis]